MVLTSTLHHLSLLNLFNNYQYPLQWLDEVWSTMLPFCSRSILFCLQRLISFPLFACCKCWRLFIETTIRYPVNVVPPQFDIFFIDHVTIDSVNSQTSMQILICSFLSLQFYFVFLFDIFCQFSMCNYEETSYNFCLPDGSIKDGHITLR